MMVQVNRVNMDEHTFEPDPATAQVIQEYMDSFEKKMGQTIGYSATEFDTTWPLFRL